MNRLKFTTLTCFIAMAFITDSTISEAQNSKARPSPKASSTQRIGVDTDITIEYSRPAVKERTVWGGELVPYGMFPGNKYSKNNDFPWRAGANENTTIEFNHDLKIEGQKIPAGKYSIHMVASEKSFEVIFNKKNAEWGAIPMMLVRTQLRQMWFQ